MTPAPPTPPHVPATPDATAPPDTPDATAPPAARAAAVDAERAQRDREYSPSSLVPNMNEYLREYAERSSVVRRSLPWQELAYGSGPAERLDFFPPARLGREAAAVPLHVFVHGGYWQALGKEDSSFAAPDFVEREAAFAALDYGLAPAYRLDQIVAMVRRALVWLYDRSADLGVDRGRIFLSGSSAGAHLVAMCLLDGWLPEPLRPTDVVAGAVLLSGVYELEPLRHTYVGESIRLTAEEAARNSPIRYLHRGLPPVVVARGENETAAFAEQQDAFVAAVAATGASVEDVVVAGRHHFDLPFDLGDPASPVGRAGLSAMGCLDRP